MAYHKNQTTRAASRANTLYVAGNIIFELDTGKTTRVLMIVAREDDASVFTEADANAYLGFVKRRATEIQWSVQPSSEREGMFIIKGVQNI